jgi:hypothetical protein
MRSVLEAVVGQYIAGEYDGNCRLGPGSCGRRLHEKHDRSGGIDLRSGRWGLAEFRRAPRVETIESNRWVERV